VTHQAARPLWEALVGQEGAATALRRALARDRVAHAYAFLGPAGVGRRLAALALGQSLLCRDGGCGGCSACRRVAAGQHPDCRVITATPPAENPRGTPAIRIEDIRAVEHGAALTAHEGPYKIFVLDEADRMTAEAAQALLKTLEEPPLRTVLILILANPRALPPTVLSRCQHIRFRPLAEPEIARLLEERGVEPALARRQARVSGGQVGLALTADLTSLDARETAALALLRTPRARQPGRLDEANLDRDRGTVAGYLEVYLRFCRDALCLQSGADPSLLFDPDRGELAEVAAGTPRVALIAALDVLREARVALDGNVSPRLCLEQALVGLGDLRGLAA